MSYTPKIYRDIYNLIEKSIPYRSIALQLGITKNTVASVKQRKIETGSIYPANLKVQIYDPYFKSISDRIKYWSSVTVKSYRKNLNRSLFKDEIYEHIIKEFPTLSFSNFKYLHTLENKKQEETYLTIHYNPGEIVQFDWGYMTMNLNDSNKRIYFAVFYFPYSHYHICAVTDKEASVNFHHVFQYFLSQVKNIPEKLVIDNMKIANKLSIKLSPKTNNENKLTRFFQELSDYYKFKVCFCAVNCPNQKGHVETGVKVVKNIIKNSGISEFKSLEWIFRLNNSTKTVKQVHNNGKISPLYRTGFH